VNSQHVAFGPFEFDRSAQLLAREGQEVPLPPRVLGVLDLLVARPGQIVSRQELIETVWKDAFVSDTSLAEAISFLRQALGDDPQQPSYIQTVHRRGYRFLPTPDGQAFVARREDPGRSATASAERSADAPAERQALWHGPLPWGLVVLLAAISASTVWRIAHPEAPALAPMARFDIALPDGTWLDRSASALAISADGSRVAFTACGPAARGDQGDAPLCRVYARTLDDPRAQPVPGTDGAAAPFLSADGSSLGFFADGKLRVMSMGRDPATRLAGPVALADSRHPFGAAWLDDSTIVFSGSLAGPLMRIAQSGDAARPVVPLDAGAGELAQLSPEPLPGGRVVLVTSLLAYDAPVRSRIVALAVDTGQRTVVLDRASDARFVAPGTLVFARGGALMAAAFDAAQLKVVGPPVTVMSNVGEAPAQVAVSRAGSIVAALAPGDSAQPLSWISADGAVVPLALSVSGAQRWTSPALSPDGRRIVAVATDDDRADLWSMDVDRGALARLTFEGEHRDPRWSPDGRTIVFAARSNGVFNLFARGPLDATTSAARQLIRSPHYEAGASVAPDGRLVAFTELDPATGADIVWVPLAGGSPAALVRTPFDEAAPAFSPDGRWLAYQGNESNRWEVYVRPFVETTGAGAAIPISTGGGRSPVWSRDGRTVYYAGPIGVMAVAFNTCGNSQDCGSLISKMSRPKLLARGSWIPRGASPDGRLLVERERGRLDGVDRLRVTLQWTRELQRIVPPAVVATPK